MMGEEKIPEPISTGIILNVTSQTAKGSALRSTSSPGCAGGGALSNERDVIVRFSEDNKSSEATFIGSYRRVTGTLEASSFERMSGRITTTSYTLKCRPAQRMF